MNAPLSSAELAEGRLESGQLPRLCLQMREGRECDVDERRKIVEA